MGKKSENKDHKMACNNEGLARRRLCYISVVALFLAVFTSITPSGIRD